MEPVSGRRGGLQPTDSAQLLIVLLTDSHLSDACPSVNIWEEAAEEETADRM